jgi:hypothetical protein
MGQITVFSGPERRRRWSDEERLPWNWRSGAEPALAA